MSAAEMYYNYKKKTLFIIIGLINNKLLIVKTPIVSDLKLRQKLKLKKHTFKSINI